MATDKEREQDGSTPQPKRSAQWFFMFYKDDLWVYTPEGANWLATDPTKWNEYFSKLAKKEITHFISSLPKQDDSDANEFCQTVRILKVAKQLQPVEEEMQVKADSELMQTNLHPLACHIARTFSEEWECYQHWLRDVLESRPLLLKKYKSQQVATWIIYWRLLRFGWAVGWAIASGQVKRLIVKRRKSA